MPNKKELQSTLQVLRTDNRFTDHDKKSAHFLLLHAAGLSESNALSADRDVDLCRCAGKNVNGLCHDLRCPSSALWVVISVQKLLFLFSCHTACCIVDRYLFFACCRGGFYAARGNPLFCPPDYRT